MSFPNLSAWLCQFRRSHRRSRVSLHAEELEHRTVPSVTVVPQQFSTNQYTALSISQNHLLAGDSGSGTLTASNPTQPANATLVDNHNGTFTFTPDPSFSGSTSFQYTVAAHQTIGNNFGSSVSVSGDTAVIGSPYNNGATYVFVRSGSTGSSRPYSTPPTAPRTSASALPCRSAATPSWSDARYNRSRRVGRGLCVCAFGQHLEPAGRTHRPR